MEIDRKTLALGIALGYPEQAFDGLGSSAYARAEELVRRVGLGEPVTGQVTAFLQEEEELGEWIAELLEDPDLRPPHLRPRAVMSYSRLASGEPAPFPPAATRAWLATTRGTRRRLASLSRPAGSAAGN